MHPEPIGGGVTARVEPNSAESLIAPKVGKNIIIYLPIYLHTYIHSYVHIYLRVCIYVRTDIHTGVHKYLRCIRGYIPSTYLPTYLPTYLQAKAACVLLHAVEYRVIEEMATAQAHLNRSRAVCMYVCMYVCMWEGR